MTESLGTAVLTLTTDAAQFKSGLAQAEKDVGKSFGSMEGVARKAIGAMGAAFSALQVKAAIDQVVGLTDEVTDLASKAGISVGAVQELKFVAEQSGSSFDDISRAIVQMGDRLVSGDKSAVAGLKTLGLNFDTIRNMAPDKAFEAIAGAIAKVPDPMDRSKVAMDLFGKSGAELLPVMMSDIGGLRDRANELGLVMGDDVVNAGAKLDDRMEELQTRMTTLKANALLPMLETFMELPTSMQTGVVAIGEFGPALSGIATTIMMAGGPMAIIGMLKTALLGLAGLLTMPAGLVVAAVVGLVAIWHQWDNITAIAQNVYTGVKTWLVDKFEAIVQSIKGKIDAVTGFFRGMYEKVVGHSYVPDMIAGIAAEFVKLDGVMVNPVSTAVGFVTQKFDELKGKAVEKIQGLLVGIQNKLTSTLPSIFGGKDGKGGLFGSLMSGGLSALLGPAGPLSGLISSGISALANVALKGLSKMWSGIKNIFGGGEEGTIVNPARDQWFGGRDVQTIGNELGAKGVDGETARQMIERVFNSKKKSDFDAASGAIDNILKNVPHLGTGGIAIKPMLSVIGDRGPEAVIPLGRNGNGTQKIVINLEGRTIAEAMVPFFPDAVRRYV